MRTPVTAWPSAPATLRRWADRVFVAAVAHPLTPRTIAAGVGSVLVAALLSLARQRGVGATDTIWAEDGTIFLADAIRMSFPEALATPYNGYFQVIPRLLFLPVPLFPATMAAGVIAVEAAVVNAAFALLVYVASGPVLRRVPLRLLAAAMAVLPPVGTGEVFNSVANVHWAGLYALFWVLLWLPASRAGRVVAVVVTVAVSFTNILVVAFVPLALARVWRRHDRHSLTLASLILAGLVTHGVGLVAGLSTRNGELTLDLVHSAVLYLKWTVPAVALGDGVIDAYLPGQRPLRVLGWLVVLAFVVVGVLRRRAANWPLAIVAAGHSVLLWLVSLTSNQFAPRYFALAGMLLVAALAALLAPAPDSDSARVADAVGGPQSAPSAWTRRLAAPAGYALLAVYLVAFLQTLPLVNTRGHGPAWSESVANARAQCARTDGRGDGDGSVAMPISPTTPVPWAARLPCTYLS